MNRAIGALAGVPLLLYAASIPLIQRLDVSRNARAVIIGVGGLVCIAASVLILLLANRKSR